MNPSENFPTNNMFTLKKSQVHWFVDPCEVVVFLSAPLRIKKTFCEPCYDSEEFKRRQKTVQDFVTISTKIDYTKKNSNIKDKVDRITKFSGQSLDLVNKMEIRSTSKMKGAFSCYSAHLIQKPNSNKNNKIMANFTPKNNVDAFSNNISQSNIDEKLKRICDIHQVNTGLNYYYKNSGIELMRARN